MKYDASITKNPAPLRLISGVQSCTYGTHTETLLVEKQGNLCDSDTDSCIYYYSIPIPHGSITIRVEIDRIV